MHGSVSVAHIPAPSASAAQCGRSCLTFVGTASVISCRSRVRCCSTLTMASPQGLDPLGKQLYGAAMTGDHVQAALLLDQGASVNWISPSDYSTPLHVAASIGHESVVRVLLDRGASVNVEDNSNRTPLHGTALSGHQVLAALLLDRGASINAETRDNLTPLHCAAQGGHESVVRMLLDRGADTTIVSVRQYPCCCC